jgi:transposase-like protein
LIEMDDTYFGASRPGKRGRGAAGKAKVVVGVETPKNKPRFALMDTVPRVSGQEIQALVRGRLVEEVVVKTDGWQEYSSLDALPYRHVWLFPGSGKEAPMVLPWVHALIANIKGNIRGVHHGVSPKHLPRYLAEFCYRFNRRFWEPQMFNRMLHACVNTSGITFSDRRQ